MLKIYFDDVLINEDSFAGLNNEYKLFNDSFYLGSVASNTFELKVLKSSVASHPQEVTIEDDNTTFHLIVDEVLEEKGFYNYTLVDKMVNFNFNYDAKPLIDEKTVLEENCYLSDILADMCLKAGVELDYILTNDIIVSWYDSRIQARDYLSFIAELEGGYACINELGKLTIKQHKQASKKSITADEVSELIIGEKKKITRVVYDNGIVKYEFGDDIGNTLYLNQNNVFITDELVVENIYNKIVGFEFYTITVPKTLIDSSIKAGDIITFVDGEDEYPTIAQYSSSYAGGWVGSYEFNINTAKQEETKVLGIEENILSIRTEIDRTNASLKITAEKTDENESYISDIQLTPEEIRLSASKVDELDEDINNPTTGLSKKYGDLLVDVNALRGEIGDVTDITSTQEGNGELQFDNVNASEPINMIIKPTVTEDILRIFPSSDLFPSPTLYTKSLKMYFHNTTEDETFIYTLPSDLRYYSGVADEFQWDYENQSCRIIRRIGLDENLDKYILAEEDIEEYDMPLLFLTTGDYTISIPSFPNAYMKIRLMSQNMYTAQFATKVELNAKIEVTAQEISSEVSKKVGNDEIISKINQSAEAVQIDANKISLTGKIINLTSDDIKINSTNFNVTKEGVVTANQLKANNADITGKITATSGSFSGHVNATSGSFSGHVNATSGSFSGSIYSSSGTIGGWNLTSTHLYSSASTVTSYIYRNGNVVFGGNYGMIKFDTDPVRITTANKLLISDSYSASSLPSTNDTIAIRGYNGTIHINSNYGVYANNTLLASGSSRKMKKNIKLLSMKEKTELYDTFKSLKSYKYDYREKYSGGQRNNYGFIIEDFEDGILGEILHIKPGIDDDNTKYFSHDDLTRVNSILIQELIAKIEKLEVKINGKAS
ncbi:MAG TPA: tail fiber domain-containing protein [Acholeplasmataceae bacterium]|nr:tail fiber domain-containing protein [Acholeplasmataceae bacterium]